MRHNGNMNKMRFLYLTLPILFFMVCAAGCGGDSPDITPKPDSPDVTPDPDHPEEELPVPILSFTSLTLPNDGDTFACVVHGLADGKWTAESNRDWCTVSVQGNILKITVMPNAEAESRTANISIYHSDKRLIRSIAVYQKDIVTNDKITISSSSKHSFFPLFTATWCPYSPEMDHTLLEIQKRWDYPILPMRIHVKGSGLYTPLSDELSELYDNNTTPTGYFENYFEADNMVDNNVSIDNFWNLVLWKTSDNGYSSNCSLIDCTATMHDTMIEAEVTIKPVTKGEYKLLAYILEDNIIEPQMSKKYGEIPDYRHDGVLVGALMPQELHITSTQKAISIAGPVPPNVNLSNIRLLIVLERNDSNLNYSDKCWYADNCISVPLGRAYGNGQIETIYVGEEIEN